MVSDAMLALERERGCGERRDMTVAVELRHRHRSANHGSVEPRRQKGDEEMWVNFGQLVHLDGFYEMKKGGRGR